MNASTRKCTDTRPCNLINCYGCRRRLIDETATAMIELGMAKDAVDQYRYSSINNLAWEIKTPAPKAPKAKAAPRLKADRDYQATADKLRVCGSRQYAAELLKGHTVAELEQVWTLAGRVDKIIGKLKANKIDYVIDHLVGYRLDTVAIMGTFNR